MMKIIVDEMPSKEEDCRFSRLQRNVHGDQWWGCSRGTIACPTPEKCYYFVSLAKYLSELKPSEKVD